MEKVMVEAGAISRFFYFCLAIGDKGKEKGARITSNPLIYLVAGRGFEPLTFGL